MDSLYKKLKNYKKENIYPFHMPGHKRNVALFEMDNPYSMDITEIEGFDNLQHAEGILKESMDLASMLYQSKYTHYLVNGSTGGLLSAIAACTNRHDQILVARNCHKSVYNALVLNELEPVYIYPQEIEDYEINGGISPKKIKELLIEYPKIKAVVLTSPTYEGVLSDIKSIAAVVHEHSIPLIVDEAHGAHLGFHSYFPKGAITQGADLVIHSVHKTLPCFTQTALLHNNGAYVTDEQLTRCINMYQTTSPSYLLLGSIDRCMHLLERQKKELFEQHVEKLEWFYKKAVKFEHIVILNKKLVEPYTFDPSKIVISVKNTSMNGKQLYDVLLNKYKIQLEMVSGSYGIAMTSIGDTWEGLKRLYAALKEIDKTIISVPVKERPDNLEQNKMCLLPYEAVKKPQKSEELEKASGQTAGEYVYLYPPGIPILVPGEEITENLVEKIEHYQQLGFEVVGIEQKRIHVI